MTNEELITRIHAGIDTAENMLLLYQQNSGMIYTIARKYAGFAEMDDLTQEGYIALCKAVDGYKTECVPFSSYAWKVINRCLLRYIYKDQNLPEYMQHLSGQYRQLTNAFLARYGRKPVNEEYRHYLDVTKEQLKQIEKSLCMEHMESLDNPIGEEREAVLADTVASGEDVEASVLDEVCHEQLKAALWGAVDKLPGEQPEIIRKRYIENMTLKQIGQGFGFSQDHARQIEKKALRKLRSNSCLRSFCEIYFSSIRGTGAETFSRTWTSSTERTALERLAKFERDQTAWEQSPARDTRMILKTS